MARALALCFLSTLLSEAVLGVPMDLDSRGNVITAPYGYHSLLFVDDFSTYRPGAQPYAGKWNIDTGTSYPGGPANWGTGEVQTYTRDRSNLVITPQGTLQITPLKDGAGHWTSARIETTPGYDFACPPGKKIRLEATLKFGSAAAPTQLGIWPAFWSLGNMFRGNYQNWPEVSELDVVETLNGLPTAWHTLHCGVANGGPCNEPTGLGNTSPLSRGVFHRVSLEIDRTNPGGDWQGEKLVWYVDNQVVLTIYGSRLGSEDVWDMVARCSHFILLDVAVGGAFPDAIAQTSTPTPATVGGPGAAMEVKWVAVFST